MAECTKQHQKEGPDNKYAEYYTCRQDAHDAPEEGRFVFFEIVSSGFQLPSEQSIDCTDSGEVYLHSNKDRINEFHPVNETSILLILS